MTKNEFIEEMTKHLSGIPKKDLEKSIEFYTEIINERMDAGLSEEAAIDAIGSMDDVGANVLEETPLPSLIKERLPSIKSLETWEKILLIIGSPLWVSVGLAVCAIVLAVYMALCVVIIACFATVIALCFFAVAGVIGGAFIMLGKTVWSGIKRMFIRKERA